MMYIGAVQDVILFIYINLQVFVVHVFLIFQIGGTFLPNMTESVPACNFITVLIFNLKSEIPNDNWS